MTSLNTIDKIIEYGQRSSSGKLIISDYNVHGVTTRLITDSTKVSQAVDGLLDGFKTEAAIEDPAIEFSIFSRDELDGGLDAPEGTPLLYDWDAVKILHAGDRRYLQLDRRGRVSADLSQSRAAGFVLRESLDYAWLISHQVFYPLWGQMMKEHGLYPFHAAGLTRSGSAFLFPGRSGSGKSTLSLELVGSGYGFLSDDTVFLRESNEVVDALSFPEEINVTDETRKLIPELDKVKKFNIDTFRQKSSFAIESLFPACQQDSGVPSIIMFPEVTGSDSTAFLPMTRTEALAFSMRFGFFFIDPSTTGRHFEILSLLVKQAQCYRLMTGTNREEWRRMVTSLLDGS
ncbi:MAG: hypothetical protein M1309_03690 [Actinobacteria bacterium]|nr:hypothetical protein [Actinomycetota bacterium]